ncbi:GGDEF domain-containing protein [Methylocaldum sp. RMAD-M]|uniref:GGDEF domain-containing protein n=1 Tax=Methylocaldum sp. RMAD-M TaxID=2806557 RepID=UPI000A325E99|nr:GGDEF domain-containing protein [Methylocaldum sp. RMAD-M]MBP1149740.1 GGDEF domain-containing protein [Methylocaldum sp. RMAD-M]
MQTALVEALDRAPMGVAIMRDRRILWVNERLAQWFELAHHLDGWAPKTAEDIGLAVLFAGDDRLCVTRSGEQFWLQRECAALADGSEAYFFQDVTENVRIETARGRLQELVNTLHTKDSETGLLNRNAILQALEGHVSRSRRYGNALSVIRVTLQPPRGASLPETTLREIAQEFNAQLRWADQIGRLDETAFLLILPETVRTDAEALATKFGAERVALAGAEMWRIDCAVASWQKGDDARKLMQRLHSEPYGPKLS